MHETIGKSQRGEGIGRILLAQLPTVNFIRHECIIVSSSSRSSRSTSARQPLLRCRARMNLEDVYE